MANLVVHFEIHASEPQRLIDFYSELLGWRFGQWGEVPYWTIETGEGAIGRPDTGSTAGWSRDRAPSPSWAHPSSAAISSSVLTTWTP